MNPVQATLKAMYRLRSLQLAETAEVRIWKMSFVIGSRKDFVEGKNDLPPTNRSFILRDLNGRVEYLWSIY